MIYNDLLYHLRNAKDNQKHILIGGSGRIGSATAMKCAKYGFGRLTIIDNDTVSEDSIIANSSVPFNFFDIDNFKVNAIKNKIAKVNPKLHVTAHKKILDVNQPVQTLLDIFSDSVLFLNALDSQVGLKVTQIPEIMQNRIAVYPAMFPKKGGGFVAIWIPTITPCILHSLRMESFDQFIESKASEANITSKDIEVVSDIASRIVKGLLFRSIESLRLSICLAKGNVLEIKKLKDRGYRRIWRKPKKKKNCPLCQLHINLTKGGSQ